MSSTIDLATFGARMRALIPDGRSFRGDGGADFNELALELFALQFASNPVYRRLCEGRGIMPGKADHWTNIPAVPTNAFKEMEVSCIPGPKRTRVFHSSGTTQQRPSRHFHCVESMKLYERSLLAWFGGIWPSLGLGYCVTANEAQVAKRRSLNFVFLTPPPSQAPNSSLVHMFETIRREWGSANSRYLGTAGDEGSWLLDRAAVDRFEAFAQMSPEPLHVFGTAFSFVHLLEAFERGNRCCALPEGSTVMETGGYKGRSRVLGREELYTALERALQVRSQRIISEYGMSELSSQAYRLASSGQEPAGKGFLFPPWTRFEIVSPETGKPVERGETGLLRVYDLANAFSVMAVETEDLARRLERGFELCGRAATAEPRGCSLMAG